VKELLEQLAAAGLGVVDRFDLTDPKDVERLAVDLGAAFSNTMARISAAVPEEHRGLFFGYVFGAPLGTLNAAIGLENYDAVLAEIRKAVVYVAEQKARTAH
jgi:hypothetical protein